MRAYWGLEEGAMTVVYIGRIRKCLEKKYAALELVEARLARRLLSGINRRIKLEMESVSCMVAFQLAQKLKQERRL